MANYISQLSYGSLTPDLTGILTLRDTDSDAFCDRMWGFLPGSDRLQQDPRETPAEVERIARGDLTPDEMGLRQQLETLCGLYWEPYGRQTLIQLSLLGSIDLVIQALETSPLSTCEQIYTLLGLRGRPPESVLSAEQQATNDRIGRGDLTQDEASLRAFMETACGIAWEPAGREILLYLLNHGGYTSSEVSRFIGTIRLDGQPDTDLLNLLGSDTPTEPMTVDEACDALLNLSYDYLRVFGTVELLDPYDEETTDYMETQMRERITQGQLSSSEESLRQLIEDACGFSWELVGQELLIEIAIGGDVEAALAQAETNLEVFCEDLRQRAGSYSPLFRNINLGTLPLFSLIDGTETEQRVATSQDYTLSEQTLRAILEDRCDFTWDDGGFNLLVNIIEHDVLDETLQLHSEAPTNFCETLRESEALYDTNLAVTGNFQIDPRTATERRLAESVRLTVDELRLRGILEVSCNIPWEPYSLRLLAANIDEGTVQISIDQFNADPSGICEESVAQAVAMGMTPPVERTIERSLDAEPIGLGEATATSEAGDSRFPETRSDNDDAEQTTLLALIADCGIPITVSEELTVAFNISAGIASAIAAQTANPSAFCDQMQRLASPSPLTPNVESDAEAVTANISDMTNPPDARHLTRAFNMVFSIPESSPTVFQVERDSIQHLLLLNAEGRFVDMPIDIQGDALLPAVSPDTLQVAFIQRMSDGLRQLTIADFNNPLDITLRSSSVPGTLIDARPAWLPDDRLLISSLNEQGDQQIWIIGWQNTEEEVSSLWMTDASAPSIDSRGRNVAFVRTIDGIPNIYTAALMGGTARPITQNPNGCDTPRFGADPYVLYYSCEQMLYRYSVEGAVLLAEGVQMYAPAPIAQFLLFSDGNTLYLLDESTSEIAVFAEATSDVRSFDWIPR